MGARIAEVPVALDWSKREGESKLRVLPTMGGYARLMMRQVADAGARHDRDVVRSLPRRRRRHRRRRACSASAGYRLAQRGVPVTVYEASSRVGGLAGTTHIGGVEVDRYYHAVTTEDERMLALAEELGPATSRSAGARSASASTTTAGSPRCRRRARR